MTWESTLRDRLGTRSLRDGHVARISIKVRADAGCFHRCCCPAAHRLIDKAMEKSLDSDTEYERHESGPELLVYLAVGTAAITLAKSVIDLVTAIIKARTEGQSKGDRRREPIVLIVRGFDKDGKLFDERVLEIHAGETPSREIIQKVLTEGINKHLSPDKPSAVPRAMVGKVKKPCKRKADH